MQKVVRTYPETYINSTKRLSTLLKEGYKVIMCHEFDMGSGEKCLEYIVEKNEEKE